MATLLTTTGIALADSFKGTDGPNRIRGTEGSDSVESLARNDNLFEDRGDTIYGGCEISKRVIGRVREPTVRRGFGRVFGSLQAGVSEVL